jgi:hypothetical protein
MKTLKELKNLLTDPKRYYYETAHKVPPPYLEDPLEQRSCLMPYVLSDLKKRLYTLPLTDLKESLDSLSKMAKEFVLQELMEEDALVKTQLKEHRLERSDLFSIEVLSNIVEPFYRDQTWFYPKTSLMGAIAVASNQGILFNTHRKKTFTDFVQLLPPLLFLSTLDTFIPTKALLFGAKEFTLEPIESQELLKILFELEKIARNSPLKFLGSHALDPYSIFQSIAPTHEKENLFLVEKLNALLKDLYERF